MRGQRWAEILIASLTLGSLGLIFTVMAGFNSGRRAPVKDLERIYTGYIAMIGIGTVGLLLALSLGIIFAFFPGLVGRRHQYQVTIECVFVATSEGHILFGAHPAEMPGELRARLTINGSTEEYACRKQAYLALRGASMGTAIIDGGLVVAFTPFKSRYS